MTCCSSCFSLTLPTLHMIILSRYALPFSIARMKVRNQVVEITAQEMKISYEETAAFFRDIMSLSLADVQLSTAGRTNGGLAGRVAVVRSVATGQAVPGGHGRCIEPGPIATR